ncbi:MAG: hypothetical protein OEZ59_03530 [Deltaproteobacteria bacterium]|nr:hypothetical protein [Deltaproteobacteria bacterium]
MNRPPRVLRVDLTQGRLWDQEYPEQQWRGLLGGAGLGARIIYDEVPPETGWDHPENRLVMATGPFAGTPLWGTGGLTVVTRGAMTGGAASTQANGFFGTNLKSTGYDAIIIQGASPDWVYLHIGPRGAALRDASHLRGRDTWQVQQDLEEELCRRGRQLSVFSSGPAGENRVRFAAIQGDYGHVASKNGVGAVMGAKKLKAVAISRGDVPVSVHDGPGLERLAGVISHGVRNDPGTGYIYQLGTLPVVRNLVKLGALPIRNYTTNLWPEDVPGEIWEGQALRDSMAHRGHQCSACGMHHCHMSVIASGPNAGKIVDEPEYEGWSGCGWTIGCTDPQEAAWLNDRVDRACVDVNEFGWLTGWAMECHEKGLLTREQLGGIDLKWGDARAAEKLLDMIVRREGFGDVLAEGVKRAAEHIGGEALGCAVYTMKGAVPRGHDHRGRWEEMLDTALGSTGSLESGAMVAPHELGLPPRINPYDPAEVPRVVAGMLGRRHFEDSLGSCIFTTRAPLDTLCQALNAITGWDYTAGEALRFGRRTACLFRAFNVRSGIGPELDYPSKRYGSTPVDGPGKGLAIGEHWDAMVAAWYELAGFDPRSGYPLPELLRSVGLNAEAEEIWG